jgi:hypothetical protein
MYMCCRESNSHGTIICIVCKDRECCPGRCWDKWRDMEESDSLANIYARNETFGTVEDDFVCSNCEHGNRA